MDWPLATGTIRMKALCLASIILVAGATGTYAGRSPTQQASRESIVEIDGATAPHELPEYLVWSHGFSRLATMRTKNMRLALATLNLSPRDMKLASAESQKQEERDRACGESTKRIVQSMKGVKPSQIEAALRPAILECRWAVLEARDRLLLAMSFDGRAALDSWMLDARRTIKAYVSKKDLEFFRLPR